VIFYGIAIFVQDAQKSSHKFSMVRANRKLGSLRLRSGRQRAAAKAHWFEFWDVSNIHLKNKTKKRMKPGFFFESRFLFLFF
jgi:hypothetical protein